jgi:anti-sigma regulatory factor (Ser/Thr protein kinase)
LTEVDKHELSLTIPADGRYLAMLRAVIGEAVEVAGFDPDGGKEIVLALCEAVSNVISHCYQGNCEPITIRCLLMADRLEIRLRDWGPKPDPSELKGRDLDEIRPGGLGLHIMRETMDEVDFDFSHPDGTELRLVKYRPGSDAG